MAHDRPDERQPDQARAPSLPKVAGEHPDDARASQAVAPLESAPTAVTGPPGIVRLQRLAGNRAVSGLMAARSVQRHSVDEAPAPPEQEDEEDAVQRQALHSPWFGPGVPRVQRWGLGSFFSGVADTARHLVGYGDNVTFAKDVLAADGASRVQATVPSATPPKGGFTWSLIGASGGSTIDVATGEITAGTMALPAESLKVAVKATSNDPDNYLTAVGHVWLVEPTLFADFCPDPERWLKARTAFDTFIGSSYSQQAITKGLNGKYDASYDPTAKSLTLTTPMRFLFPDDVELPTDTEEDKTKRASRHQTYIDNFVNRTTSQWSGRYKFKNVRDPKTVWGKLNPITVSILPKIVKTNEYFLISAKTETTGRASVGGGKGTLFKGSDTPAAAFEAGTRAGELARIGSAAPPVFLTGAGALEDASKPTVEFLSRYLRVINRPKFKVAITGRDKASADAAKARGQTVADALTGFGLGTHEVTVDGSVDGGLSDLDVKKVTFTPALTDPGFTNMQDVSSHEFGHMMGLPDEYVQAGKVVGDNLSTHDRMKAALGETYANTFGKVTGDAASIMEGGDDVRMHHYIHFWDTLVLLAGKAAVPDPKMGEADWKFYE